MKKPLIVVLLLIPVIAVMAQLPRSPSPQDAEVYIVSPQHGDTVASPVRVVFGLRGMGIAPAGINQTNTGHHHLLIDTEAPPSDRPIPADEHHKHFGGGQTETVIEPDSGDHTLQLVLADYLHVPHDPAVCSERITITVR